MGNRRSRCTARGVQTASLFVDALRQAKPDAVPSGWTERIDPTRVGILGYALGGSVAAQASLTGRFAAAANFAGDAAGHALPLTSPYLLLLSDSSNHAARPGEIKKAGGVSLSFYRNAQRQAAQPKSHVIEIAGACNEHFRDAGYRIWPLSQAHAPAPNRIRSIIDSYTVAFFSTYLRGAANPLMRVRHSPYPEVKFLPPLGTSLGSAI
jgi:hypothetical protein